jgi:hypothetical protein
MRRWMARMRAVPGKKRCLSGGSAGQSGRSRWWVAVCALLRCCRARPRAFACAARPIMAPAPPDCCSPMHVFVPVIRPAGALCHIVVLPVVCILERKMSKNKTFYFRTTQSPRSFSHVAMAADTELHRSIGAGDRADRLIARCLTYDIREDLADRMRPGAVSWSRVASRGGVRSAPVDASRNASAERKVACGCPLQSGKELAGSTVPTYYGSAIPRREPWPARRIRLRWPAFVATSRAPTRRPRNGSGRLKTTRRRGKWCGASLLVYKGSLLCYERTPSCQLIFRPTSECSGYYWRVPFSISISQNYSLNSQLSTATATAHGRTQDTNCDLTLDTHTHTAHSSSCIMLMLMLIRSKITDHSASATILTVSQSQLPARDSHLASRPCASTSTIHYPPL